MNINDISQTRDNLNDSRDPNDRSLNMNHLEHSQFSYSKTNNSNNITYKVGTPSIIDSNQVSGLTQFEQTERISQMNHEIKSYQKIIAKQQESIRMEATKREKLELIMD